MRAATRPLHIAILDYRDISHSEAGGAEVYIYEIFRRIADLGHRVTWISARDAGAAEERRGNLHMVRVGNKMTANFTSAREALRLAQREPVDLFIENLCKIPFFLPLYTQAPVLPIVLHLFGETVFREVNPLLASYVWMYERFIPRVYRDKPFVALSDSTAADLRKRGVRMRWVDVVPPGLDLEQFRAVGERAAARPPLVVYVGRLKRYKQIDIALEAFARVHREQPQARMVVVGKGDDRERLESVVQKCGIANVVDFRGFVSEAEKIDWIRRARVVVYPSPKEGWGISTTEAAACGTPVIASNSPGLRDAVLDGRTGYLVPHEDVAAWAAPMAKLLRDDAVFAELSAGAIAWAREFDWDARASQMWTLVERAVAEARVGTRPEDNHGNRA